MKRLIILISILAATTAFASTYGKLFDALLVSQRAGGVTLASGKAYFYSPGTTNAKTVYTDYNKTTPASQPVTLSADGTAAVYGDGLYDVKITNSTGVQKAYWYNVTLSLDVDYATAAGTATTATTAVNAANSHKFGGYSTHEFIPATAQNAIRLGGYSSAKYARYSGSSSRLNWSAKPAFRGAQGSMVNLFQQISSATSGTWLKFSSEVYDTDSIHDTSTNNHLFNKPSDATKIRLCYGVSFTANDAGYREVQLIYNDNDLNSSLLYRKRIYATTGDATYRPTLHFCSNPIQNTTTGTAQYGLKVIQNSGSALYVTAGSYFSMEIIE